MDEGFIEADTRERSERLTSERMTIRDRNGPDKITSKPAKVHTIPSTANESIALGAAKARCNLKRKSDHLTKIIESVTKSGQDVLPAATFALGLRRLEVGHLVTLPKADEQTSTTT